MKKKLKKDDSEVIRLIKRDESHRSYFFKRVSEKRWYFKLKGEGFFDIEQIPDPVISEDGSAYFPGWLPFIYFEKLAKNLDLEEDVAILNDLVRILESIAGKKIHNPHVWADFIRVVSNLPNKSTSQDLLKNVSNWLDTEYKNSLPSHEIGKNLLPKFLSEDASKEEFEKAEVILIQILNLKEENYQGPYSGYSEKKYKPLIDLYWLRHTLIENQLLELIGKNLSPKIIYKLAGNLREMLYGQVVEKILSSKFFLRFDIEDRNLKVFYDPDPDTNLEDATTVVIPDFQKFEEQELANQITERVKGESPNIDIEFDTIEYFTRRLFTDHSIIWCNSLHKLKNGEIMRDETKIMHVHLLMELARIKAETDEKVFTELKEKFLGNEFPQPIFERILFYALSKTWDKNKTVFWELVQKEYQAGYFSNSLLSKEIFFLLRENVEKFDQDEKNKLKEIIESGPKGERVKEGKQDTEYWQLQWYAALKDDPEFTESYKALSSKLNLDAEHYETLGEVKTSFGSTSPFSPEEIIDMGPSQLLKKIEEFKPGRDIDDPTYDGFGNAIMSAVAQKPSVFTDELHLLIEAPFFCVYNYLLGFQRAWEDKKTFDWEEVLNFIYDYINTDSFKNNELIVEADRLGMDKELIIHQAGRLITEGTKKDSNAFDADHLPIAKKILQKIVPELDPVYDIDESNMDYSTYSLNSKAGKVLMALINYSLRFARVHYGEDHERAKWDKDLKELYEGVIRKNVIDSFILVGFYFPQLNYLDKVWTQEKIKKFEGIDEKEWKAFMGGYLWRYPARNKEIYKLMLPHYRRSINTNATLGDFDYKSTVNHIAAFYLWGIEGIEDGELINLIIENGRSEDLSRIPNFFWEVNDQIKGNQREELRPKILQLWQRIHERVEGAELKEKEKVLSNLSKFMKYFDRLDDDIAPFIKASAPFVNHNFNVPFFLEELNRLKNYSQSKETAKHIGDILMSMLKEFTPDFQESDIKELVSYMYAFKEDNEIRDLADSICAEYTRRGKEFLRVLYKENR
ncbi:MAG: hypothetical protein WD053_06475 [Gracilimonas sp.]